MEDDVECFENGKQDVDFEIGQLFIAKVSLLLSLLPLIQQLHHTLRQQLYTTLEIAAHGPNQPILCVPGAVDRSLQFLLAGEAQDEMVELESKK